MIEKSTHTHTHTHVFLCSSCDFTGRRPCSYDVRYSCESDQLTAEVLHLHTRWRSTWPISGPPHVSPPPNTRHMWPLSVSAQTSQGVNHQGPALVAVTPGATVCPHHGTWRPSRARCMVLLVHPWTLGARTV